jgi:hypothetical protein
VENKRGTKKGESKKEKEIGGNIRISKVLASLPP